MAVLGVGGRLILRREAPEPCLVNPESISAASNTISSICTGYWSGDKVSVDCLPIVRDGFPANPAGYATYFSSRWFLGPNRSHIDALEAAFYKTDAEEYPDGQTGDAAQFYSRSGDVSGGETIPDCAPGDYYIHIDALGNVSFYLSRCAALAGGTANRVQLESIDGPITIAPYGHLEYANAVWECAAAVGDYQFSDGQDTVTLTSICADAPLYQEPAAGVDEYDNADLLPRDRMQGSAAPYWEVLCDIQDWSLELSAPSVDTTAISEKFGEAVKSLVTGGGSVNYFIDPHCHEEGTNDSTVLMKLLMMTERGCKATGKFYMLTGDEDANGICNQRSGDLYYEADMLVTATAVNLRPTELVAGSANFATTGEIRLLEAP